MTRKLCLLLSLFALSNLYATPEAWAIEAGTARIDVTPPMEMGPSLGGYGERMSEPAKGVHDRVWAKAIAFKNGEDRFAFVTIDTLGFAPPVKKAVMERLDSAGWKSEQVLLLPSHSHTSHDMTALNPDNKLGIPQLGVYQPEVYAFVVERIAQAILDASKKTEEIRVGTASLDLNGWARNRRRGGTVTHEVLTVTRIDKVSGEPLAALINWAAHPTFMGPSEMWYSGGWPGQAQRTVETLIGDGVTAFYYNGAEGDQSPVARADSGDSAWEKANRYGLGLGNLAHGVWEGIEPSPLDSFSYALDPIELPARKTHPDFMKTGGSEYGMRPEIMEMLLNQLVPAESATAAFRLGDLLVAGVPGEMAADLGIETKKRVAKNAGAKHVVIGGLANEWISYILSPKEYSSDGRYEASVSFYGAGLGPVMVDAVAAAASKLDK